MTQKLWDVRQFDLKIAPSCAINLLIRKVDQFNCLLPLERRRLRRRIKYQLVTPAIKAFTQRRKSQSFLNLFDICSSRFDVSFFFSTEKEQFRDSLLKLRWLLRKVIDLNLCVVSKLFWFHFALISVIAVKSKSSRQRSLNVLKAARCS